VTVFTYSQARQNLARLLDSARREGCVRIRRKGGQVFSVCPVQQSRRSPLDVKGVKTKATTQDILTAIRESRERG